MINSYDDRYEIRLAKKSDIPDIMLFIENNWKSGHVLARSRELFEYEFLDENGVVNFILAIDRTKNNIEGVLGFLKASHDKNNLDVWSVIWKVIDGSMSMLGMELVLRMSELVNARCELGVGDNPKTAVPVLKVLLKRYVAKMGHYYMLSEMEDFKIAKIVNKPEKKDFGQQFNVVRFDSIEDLEARFECKKFVETKPYKDLWYINHRFFMHPVYDYDVYGIEDENGIVNALIVLRNQVYEDRVAIRFVDCIGENRLLSGTGAFFNKLLNDGKSEYIDLYCAGVNAEYIRDAGFSEILENDENIIPNYFSPFCQENIDIWVDSTDANALFFKADADQDRPN